MLQPICPKKSSVCYPFEKRLERLDMLSGREGGEEMNCYSFVEMKTRLLIYRSLVF
jgi:hypothetical protein